MDKKNHFKVMKSLLFLLSLTLLGSSCVTGATLRTARVLEKGQFEISGGAVGTECGDVSQVVSGAYGVSEKLEIEGRWENTYIALTPRLQILKSETSMIDCLTFFEFGYSDFSGFQWGPGMILGRRWDFIEPYLSYRFRYFNSISNRHQKTNRFRKKFLGTNHFHYLKLGNRFYLPRFENDPEKHSSQWFIGVEGGATIFASEAIFEWGANIGFVY